MATAGINRLKLVSAWRPTSTPAELGRGLQIVVMRVVPDTYTAELRAMCQEEQLLIGAVAIRAAQCGGGVLNPYSPYDASFW